MEVSTILNRLDPKSKGLIMVGLYSMKVIESRRVFVVQKRRNDQVISAILKRCATILENIKQLLPLNQIVCSK